MATQDYHFVTRWRMRAMLDEVNRVLGDAISLPRWWPAVYLAVDVLDIGDPHTGVGRVIGLFTKGWLPYTLRWRFTITESAYPHGFTLLAQGDFVGRGQWTFDQDGDFVNIVYDWRISAEKPLLKHLSFIMKPLFSANHHWAMRVGEDSLRLELRRRRAQTEDERNAVPPPPAPTFAWLLPRLRT